MARLQGTATVSGIAAVWLARELKALLPVIRAIQTAEVRGPLLEAYEDMEWAAVCYLRERSMSADGHADTQVARLPAGSQHDDDEIDPAEAMRLLEVGPRHLRRLAAQGLGVKTAGQWRLSRAAVLAVSERRQSA